MMILAKQLYHACEVMEQASVAIAVQSYWLKVSSCCLMVVANILSLQSLLFIRPQTICSSQQGQNVITVCCTLVLYSSGKSFITITSTMHATQVFLQEKYSSCANVQ